MDSDDDEKLKGVKHLLALKHKQMLDFWSKYRAEKRHSNELALFVQQMKKDIELKDRILEKEGHYIEELQDTVADLEREVKETNEQLKTTKKRLEECHGKGGSFRARPEAEALEVTLPPK